MAITGTVALAGEVKALYDADYLIACQSHLYFDQFANTRMVMNGQRGISYNFPIVESLQPTPTPLDELADVVPQQMRVNEVVITLQEWGGAVEVTEFAVATAYSDVYKQAAEANGYGMAETIDTVVRAVVGQGGRVVFQNGRTARNQFDGVGTAVDRANSAFLQRLVLLGRTLKMPLYEDGSLCAVLHPFVWYDLLQDPLVQAVAQRLVPEILFNGELAYWSGLRMVVSANAKAFMGAGATPSSWTDTALAAPANPGDTTLTVASASGITPGMTLVVQDGVETGNTWFDTNEAFVVTGVSGNQVTGYALDPGPGDGGGLRYAHASGTTVTARRWVFPICVLGPQSITKAASDLTGEFGKTVVTGPFDRLGRFLNFGWYLIAGWGRTRSGWLIRGECGSSQA